MVVLRHRLVLIFFFINIFMVITSQSMCIISKIENHCIIGKWKYEKLVNLQTGNEMNVEFSPMNGVETEFSSSGEYIQKKIKSNGEVSIQKGEWSIVTPHEIQFKIKKSNKWTPIDILSCSGEKCVLSNGFIEMHLIKINNR